MLKKLYSFAYECFKGLIYIGVTILFFYVWSKEPSNKITFLIAAFFGMFSIAINYEFYKKVSTKQTILVYKEDVPDWVIRFSLNILYLIASLKVMQHTKNADPFKLIYKILTVILTINLFFLFFNRFLGTKKEDKALGNLSKTK